MKKLLYALLPLLSIQAFAQQSQPYVMNGPRGGQARVIQENTGRVLASGRGNLFERSSGAWTPLAPSWNNGLSCDQIVSLAINAADMIAGTASEKVFFSNDNAGTWTDVTGDLRPGLVYRSVAYAAPNYLAVRADGSLYLSSDGIMWIQKNFSVANASVGYLSQKNNQLYATTSNGLYRSADNGLTFNLQNPDAGLDGKMLWVNDTLWVAGSTGLQMSIDDGMTFAPPYLAGRAVGSVAVSGSNILATVAGLNRVDSILYSSNGGASFATILPNGSFRYTTVYDMLGHSGYFLVGTDQGILYGNENNTGWRSDDSGYHARRITHLGTGTDIVYATALNEGGFRTADSAASWTRSAAAATGASDDIVAIDGFGQFAYAVGNNYYRSTNSGSSWTAGATGLTAGNYTSVGLNKTSGVVIVVRNGELYRSSDNGVTFAQVVTGIPAGIARTVYHADTSWFVAASNDSLYQAGNNFQFRTASRIANVTGVVYRGPQYAASTDGFGLLESVDGKTWSPVADPAIPASINAVVDFDTAFYLATANGLVSSKGGAFHMDSLQGHVVTSLAVSNNRLYAGTCDGVWSRKKLPPPVDTGVGVYGPAAGSIAMQVYPNPARSAAVATFSSGEAGMATLTLHDVSGRAIYREELRVQAGRNEARIPLGTLKPAPGLYFVKIRTATSYGVQRILVQ